MFYIVSPLSEGWRYFLTVCICRLVATENAPRGDKLSASVSKGKKNKEGKESRSSKGQAGSRPSSQVTLLLVGNSLVVLQAFLGGGRAL